MKDRTLVFLIDDNRICLALKKRGFGEGKLNGYGGKLEPGESIEQAAIRELEEESGVRANIEQLESIAVHDFTFDETDFALTVHAFLLREWEGEPIETEEMAPEWFLLDTIPYGRMWVDDEVWLPRILAGERLDGTFHLSNDGMQILKSELRAR